MDNDKNSKGQTFNQWFAEVNQECLARIFLGVDDLPDQLWADMFDDDYTPEEAVVEALENEGCFW